MFDTGAILSAMSVKQKVFFKEYLTILPLNIIYLFSRGNRVLLLCAPGLYVRHIQNLRTAHRCGERHTGNFHNLE